MKATWRVLALALTALAVLAAACGGDDSTETADESTSTTISVTTEDVDDATTPTDDMVVEPTDTPIDVIQRLARAMREDDAALLMETVGGEDPWFIEWLTALRAEPEFTDCTENESAVSCRVSFGDDFFYTRVLGEPQESTISGAAHDGEFVGRELAPPTGIMTAEAELRTWVQQNHPELEEQLYGTPSHVGGIKMTHESGELRMQLLDEFLESRGLVSTALGDPDTWTWKRLVASDVGINENGREFEVSSMTSGEGLFVMVGYRQRSEEADGFVESPIILTTADGAAWSTVDPTAAEPGEGLYAATFGDDGFVAVGEVGGDAIGAPPVGSGVVWTSPDGSEWIRHAPDEWAAFVPQAVTTTTDGAYVAVGATDRFRASIWNSDDGVTWTEVGAFDDPEFIGLADVAAGPYGMVAVGSRHGGDDSQALVLHSDDGLSWTDVSLDGTAFPVMTSARHVEVSGEDRFVVAGSDLSADSRAALWTSSNGVTWQKWPIESTGSLTYIGDTVSLPDSAVIVVSGASADAEEPWIEIGALWQVATVLGTTTLEPLELPEAISLGSWVHHLTADHDHLVAVGRGGENNTDLVIWMASSQ